MLKKRRYMIAIILVLSIHATSCLYPEDASYSHLADVTKHQNFTCRSFTLISGQKLSAFEDSSKGGLNESLVAIMLRSDDGRVQSIMFPATGECLYDASSGNLEIHLGRFTLFVYEGKNGSVPTCTKGEKLHVVYNLVKR